MFIPQNIENFCQTINNWREDDRIIVIRIAGFPGSGKTVLGRWLSENLINCTLISTDTYIGSSNTAGDMDVMLGNLSDPINWVNYERLQETLCTLKTGQDFSYTRYINYENGIKEKTVSITAPTNGGIILVEGTGASHSDAADFTDYSILIDTPFVLSSLRFLKRRRHPKSSASAGKEVRTRGNFNMLALALHSRQLLIGVLSLVAAQNRLKSQADILFPHSLIPRPNPDVSLRTNYLGEPRL